MAFPGMTPTNPFALPETLRNPTSIVTDRPLPPPGRPLDGTADLHPARTANYPDKLDEWTILPTGTITEDEVWAFTFTPTRMQNGIAVADALAAVTVNVTVDATATPESLAIDALAAFKAASRISTFEGVDSFVRLSEIIGEMSQTTGTMTIKSAGPDAGFTPTVVPGGSDGATIVHTVDSLVADLRVGIFVARGSGLASDGFTPKAELLDSSDTALTLLGIVADGDRVDAVADSYTYRAYRSGRDIPYWNDGTRTVYSEAAVTAYNRVWIRKTATGAEVAGAVTDTPDYTAGVYTATPTAANTTLYQLLVSLYHFSAPDTLVAQGILQMTSDADGTATEICDGLRTSLVDENDQFDDLIVGTGTTTFIMTLAAGYFIKYANTSPGVLAVAETTAPSTDHILHPTAKFVMSSAAGIAALEF